MKNIIKTMLIGALGLLFLPLWLPLLVLYVFGLAVRQLIYDHQQRRR